MKRMSTHILRGAIFLVGAVAIGLCVFFTPMFAKGAAEFVDVLSGLRYVVTAAWDAPVIPFLFALWQGMKLLSYIDKGNAFSEQSVIALKKIKYCAAAIAVLYMAAYMPVIYLIAEKDDAPGLVLIGMAVTFIPIAVATFAAILQRLLGDALEMKSENDLTI